MFFSILLAAVIIGHIAFAFIQVFFWPWLCGRITDLTAEEAESSRFLGKSIASYNASIAVGLLLSLRLVEDGFAKFLSGDLVNPEHGAFVGVQMTVMAFIAATAIVGALGTKGKTILVMRFLPAAAAFFVILLN